jgi:hypothetical protein
MIKAILHLANEQPLLVDLIELPDAASNVLQCTNVRGTNGKRPDWAESSDNVFVFPMARLSFIEIAKRELGERAPSTDGDDAPESEPMLEISAPASDDGDDLDDLLRRVREA